MAPILEVKDLRYQYGPIKAVQGISFYVDEGEIVTLIGSNGAGKTTTLRSISGMLEPKGLSGEILYDGKPIQKLGANVIAGRNLIQVLEGRHIFPRLTVEENLHVGAFRRKDKAKIKEDLAHMYKRFPRLEERKRQYGGTLSGGEQQMLAIARGLMSSPKLLMLDEPSLGLAPIIVREIFDIITSIAADGISILLVEQNSKMALKVANRGYVLETGNVTLEDSAENLMQNEEVQRSYLGG